MAFSTGLANIILDCCFGKIWYPSHYLWVGLSRANPLDNGSGLNEPDAADGYARVQVALGDWFNTYQGIVYNENVFTFPTATGNWGLIKYFVLFDTLQMIIYGELDPYVNVNSGQKPRFNEMRIQVALD